MSHYNLSEDVVDAINKSVLRNEISRDNALVIFKWADQTEIRKALLDAVKEGTLEIFGIKNGEPQFIKSNHNYTDNNETKP